MYQYQQQVNFINTCYSIMMEFAPGMLHENMNLIGMLHENMNLINKIKHFFYNLIL